MTISFTKEQPANPNAEAGVSSVVFIAERLLEVVKAHRRDTRPTLTLIEDVAAALGLRATIQLIAPLDGKNSATLGEEVAK